jgi:diguanylate cyclase (GGDEF)-like protein
MVVRGAPVGADVADGPFGRVVHVLTRPLPSHIADYREPARTVLLFVALGLTLATLWLPQHGPVEHAAVLVLAVVVGITGVASTLPVFHGLLNRVGGLLLLAQIAALIHLTGGAASIYTPLYALLLLYAAVFYGPARLLATVLVVLLVLLAPGLVGAGGPAVLTELGLQGAVWSVAALTVHLLVSGIRVSAQTDGLTSLWNHATFWELLRAAHAQHRRSGARYSVLILDLDHFKRVNDTQGHPVGDAVLRDVAALLRGRCRRSDLVARYGGEEFAVLLPDTGRGEAVDLAKELRLRVAGADLRTPVTVSIGVACSADGFGASAEAVVRAADRALYEAKAAGRNHVAVALPDPPAAPALTGPAAALR